MEGTPEQLSLHELQQGLKDAVARSESLKRNVISLFCLNLVLTIFCISTTRWFTSEASRKIDALNVKVETQELVLKDSSGKERAAFKFDVDNHPMIALFGSNGRSLFQVSTQKDDSATMSFSGVNRKVQIAMSSRQANSSAYGMVFYDENHANRIDFLIHENGEAGILIRNPVGSEQLKLAYDKDGKLIIGIEDPSGRVRSLQILPIPDSISAQPPAVK
jgi:hypothetical protein